MNRLLQIGFEPAGHWLLKDNQLDFQLTRHSSQRNILYSFVSNGEVKYIGKTIQRLYSRMCGYKNPSTSQTTNVRNNARIRRLLETQTPVDILALPDNGLLHYGPYHLNLAAGLEDSLISTIVPSWNRSADVPAVLEVANESRQPSEQIGFAKVEPQPDLSNDQRPETSDLQLPPPTASFRLILQKTYFNQGFFNVSVNFQALFGDNEEKIEIFCGDAEQPIVGLINRTANNNNTPRIMGGKGLRDWFQRNMREMQEAVVFMLSQNAIRIEPVQAE